MGSGSRVAAPERERAGAPAQSTAAGRSAGSRYLCRSRRLAAFCTAGAAPTASAAHFDPGGYLGSCRASALAIPRRSKSTTIPTFEDAFAGLDSQRQPALGWRQRADPLFAIGARGVVGIVEVEHDLLVVGA